MAVESARAFVAKAQPRTLGWDLARTAPKISRAAEVALAILLGLLLAKLVVVGFVADGIGSAVPLVVRVDHLAEVESLMDRGAIDLAEACFSGPDRSGIRTFVGHPGELYAFSRLSRAFTGAVSPDDADVAGRLRAGIAFVRGEYEAIGVNLSRVRSVYVRSAISQAGFCAVLLAALVYARRKRVWELLDQGEPDPYAVVPRRAHVRLRDQGLDAA